MIARCLGWAGVLLALPFCALPQSIEISLLKPAVIQQRLEMVSQKLPERRATLEALFTGEGCAVTTQPVRKSKQPNLICTLKGSDEPAGVIVVGGHFDLAEVGMGAIDDWSGAVLLPSLYETLKNKPRRHTFVFVAFAAEEVGMHGSQEYVDKLTREERTTIRAMINLECLGMNSPEIWASRADPQLRDAYARVVNFFKLPPLGVNVDKVGDDDSHPFRDARIPTLTLHSITQETFPLLHTSKDKVSAIHPSDYYDAYRVAATLLAYLDTK
jgi:Zn-dependent M28 family amino/carboxypeptidase